MPKDYVESACGCVVVPATGEYLKLCRDHRHLKDDPALGAFARGADVEGDRG